MGAGVPPRTIVGCRAGVRPGGRATDVGGPSDRSAYERWTRCSCPLRRRMWVGRADRGGAAVTVDSGPRAGDRVAAVVTRAADGGLRGRPDGVRAGPGAAARGDRLPGGRTLTAPAPDR